MSDESKIEWTDATWNPVLDGVQKKKNGRLRQGRTYDEMPKVQTSPVPLPKDRKAIVKEIEMRAQNYKNLKAINWSAANRPMRPIGTMSLPAEQTLRPTFAGADFL